MPMAQAGPVQLEYTDRGESQTPFVLVHGYRSSHRSFDALQTELAALGHRSIAISMRGAAGSSRTDEVIDYAPANFANDLHLALESLQVTRHLLLGHSLGARTVTNYARDHADRLVGLVLLAGGSLRARGELTPQQRERQEANIAGYPGNMDRDYWNAEHAALSPEIRAALLQDWLNVSATRMRGSTSLPDNLPPVLNAMPVPTLNLFGDQDRTLSPGGSAETYLELPADKRHLHVFHGVDHTPNGIIPDRVAAVLNLFARNVCGL